MSTPNNKNPRNRVDLRWYDEVLRLRAENAALREDNGKLRVLLVRANKWLRMVDERREDVPMWLRHGADPHPLRADINAALRKGGAE